MTTPTTAAPPAPTISALEKIKALKSQMDQYKTEAIEEIKSQISAKEQELATLRGLLAELTGVSQEPAPLAQRRKRSPNKVKDEESSTGGESMAGMLTDGKVE